MNTIQPRRQLRTQTGASAIEYALVIALVALALIVALGTFSGKITTFLGTVGGKIDDAGNSL